MIEISSPTQQDKIIELLTTMTAGDITFTYKEKKGIALYFETNTDDLEEAAKIAKKAIKGEPWGSILYFRSVPHH
ncbi:hypothetical protein GCM10012290_04350 [Halolactibacillus alkaliphilus]|uniref:Uncharacterized protein n=1 Tax=Halolactibacillus alkaliphilus TaxID=442899 RepID=A0A511WYY7_9BACI|nr:hypothetical protein [Halolactibacillus alkaliphilus]GEN55931.1 hypothetical protein HAL01_03950 [Halolactibacillus alkaliphilus]GGN65545.1 hypothetical protein GCM10012290_04350 [Halolactibacillus alkaliphilus]SFO65756.1 hypothetical protein SAMN05720591_10322 [Halolactibacillus alkaliphilus]